MKPLVIFEDRATGEFAAENPAEKFAARTRMGRSSGRKKNGAHALEQDVHGAKQLAF